MAEYFPLLERAIAGLQDATPDARRAIYERARNALLNQLRNMDPPVAEADVERESQALDEAIARLEAKVSKDRPAPLPSRPTMASRPTSAPPAPAPPAPIAPPSLAPTPGGVPVGKVPPVVSPSARERPVMPPRGPTATPGPRPSPILRPPTAPDAPRGPRPPLPIAPGAPSSRIGIGMRPPSRPVVPSSEPDAASSRGPDSGQEAPPSESPGGTDLPARGLPVAAMPTGFEQASPDTPVRAEEGFALSRIRPADEAAFGPSGRTRDDIRPLAPRAPASEEPRSLGFYIAGAVVLLAVAGIAVMAWRLRDHPETIVAAQAPATSPDSPGKIISRADDGGESRAAPAPEPTGDAAVVPAPVPQNNQQPPVAAPAATPTPTPPETAAPAAEIPVAQRAALLVDAPEDPQKVKTYVGSVVWRSESVSPGQDQPLSTAVRADIDIPDAKLTLSMVIKKNLEPQFPASHTLEFHFAEQPGNTLGSIKQINVPELRQDDTAPTGDPLIGVPVSITDDYFLVGLSRGTAEGQNLQLLAARNWIDVSILLNSGKVAKLTFEKGASGQRVLEDALRSWR